MIKSFEVINFKTIRDSLDRSEPLRLSPLTVFIGPNGVGKSSILQAVAFLQAFFFPSIETYLDSKNWQLVDLTNLRQSQKKISWKVVIDIPPDVNGNYGGEYRFAASLLKRRYITVGDERLTYIPLAQKNSPDAKPITLIDRIGRDTTLYSIEEQEATSNRFYQLPSSVASFISRDESESARYPEIVHFRDFIMSMRTAAIFDVEHLREPARGYAYELGPKGENLLPFLAHMQHNSPEQFDKLRKHIVQMFSNITDISIRGSSSRSSPKILEVYEGKKVFGGKQVSDGLLRVLAIAALLYAKSPPTVLLFEEPENGVHPRLLDNMIQIFQKMSKRRKPYATQVLMTSHSPYIVDHFRDQPASIYTIRRKNALATAEFRRLDDLFPNGLPQEPLGDAWYSNRFAEA